MKKSDKPNSSSWRDRVLALPQYSSIDPATVELWMERASEMDADDRDRLITYMGRLNADDMGAMICDKRRRFHPHTTPANVVRTKLLQERPKTEPAYKARRRMMTPIAREMLQRQVAATGGKFRGDLTEMAVFSANKNHPWLSLLSADFIEENGRIVMVEYRTPSESMSLSTRGMAFHHEVSMHYALLAAREAGVKVDAMRLCALDAKAWAVETLDLPIDNVMLEEIRQEGDRVWKGNILTGVTIPQQVINGIMNLDDLRKPGVGVEGAADLLKHVADRFLTWGVAEKECEAERADLQKEAADLLPFAALPLEVERVDANGVRFRIERDLDIDGLTGLARDLLVDRSGYSIEDADMVLKHPNYWTEAEYSSRGLIQAVETHFDIDPLKDPRFSTAIAKPSQRRADTLLDLIRSLDPEDSIRLEDYVRTGRMRMEMVAPRPRFEREQRAKASGVVREALKGVLEGVSVQPPAPAETVSRRGARRP